MKKRCLVALVLFSVVFISFSAAYPLGELPIPGHWGWEIANGSISGTNLADNLQITGNASINDLLFVRGNRVGIGTDNPGNVLDIVGNVGFSGTLQSGTVPWARLDSIPSASTSGAGIVRLTTSTSSTSTSLAATASAVKSAYDTAVSANSNANNREPAFTTLSVSKGGTGQSTLTSGSYLRGAGTSDVSLRTPAQVRNDIGAGTSNLALGATSSTAYRGDRGTIAYNERRQWNGGSTNLNAATARTSLNLNTNQHPTFSYLTVTNTIGAKDLTASGAISSGSGTSGIANLNVPGTLHGHKTTVGTHNVAYSGLYLNRWSEVNQESRICIGSGDSDMQNRLGVCPSSSIRYKTNITNFTKGLDAVMNLRPINFNWKEEGRNDLGFIAEEVYEIEPLLIYYNLENRSLIEGVNYDKFTVLLTKAIQEQQQQIEELKIQNKEFENRIKLLESK